MTEEQSQALIGEGPVPLSSDSWDFDPDEDLPNEPYRGGRRAYSPRRWLPVVVGLVVLVMTATGIAWLPISGHAGRDQPATAAGDERSPTADPSDASVGSPTSVVPSASVHTQAGAAATTTTKTTVPFPTLVYEAEAGMPDVKLSSAHVVAQAGASGGKVVAFTATSGGEIQFRRIDVPSAGTYRFAVHYAPGNAARKGLLAVDNATPLTIAFASGDACCLVSTVDTPLSPGTHTATLTLSAGDNNPPAIDVVVISRP
jgi:hypothetical protein